MFPLPVSFTWIFQFRTRKEQCSSFCLNIFRGNSQSELSTLIVNNAMVINTISKQWNLEQIMSYLSFDVSRLLKRRQFPKKSSNNQQLLQFFEHNVIHLNDIKYQMNRKFFQSFSWNWKTKVQSHCSMPKNPYQRFHRVLLARYCSLARVPLRQVHRR